MLYLLGGDNKKNLSGVEEKLFLVTLLKKNLSQEKLEMGENFSKKVKRMFVSWQILYISVRCKFPSKLSNRFK